MGTRRGYLGPVPPTPEIKLRPNAEEKALFEKAAKESKRSLNQWFIVAGLEKAARDGVTLEPAPKRKGTK